MRVTKIAAPLVLALLTAGCGPITSLHPLYTESSVVSDPALPGTWVGDGDFADGTWTFQKSGENAFELIRTPEGAPSYKFDIHLVRLGTFVFLDASRQEETVATHILGRVWIEGNVLRIALLDQKWLKDAISKKEVAVAFEQLGDDDDERGQVVLTASTEDLQKFMVQCARSDKAFSEPLELHRQK